MKEKTVIDGLIDHSKAIFKYRMFLAEIKNFLFILGRVPDTLPSEVILKDNINEIETESRRRITERNEACRKYLVPLLGGDEKAKEYGFTDRFHFSEDELKAGYVLLHKQMAQVPEKVLFLVDHDEKLTPKGDLVDYYKCTGFLMDVKSAIKPGELILKNLVFSKNQT